MAGIPPAGADPAACRATLIENLKYAAAQLAPHNITLLLEAINTRDMPGFFVSTQADSFAICRPWVLPISRCRWTATTCRSWKAISPSS